MKPYTLPVVLALGLGAACSRREAASRQPPPATAPATAPARAPTPAAAPADAAVAAPPTPAPADADASVPRDAPTADAGGDNRPPPPLANPARFGLTMTAQPMPPGPRGTPRQRLALVLRLPSGIAQTQDLGEVAGTCTAPPPPPEVLGLYHCETAGTGSEFVIRRNGPEIVVTRLGVESGTATAQSREVARMTAPAGDVVTFQVAP